MAKNQSTQCDRISACKGNPLITKRIVWTLYHAPDMLHQSRRAVLRCTGLIMWQPKPKKQPWHGNVHLQSNAINKEDQGSCLLGPWRCASYVFPQLGWCCNCCVSLWCTWSSYSRPFITLTPGLLHPVIIILQNDANQTCDCLWHYCWEVMDHPPYGPGLTPSDFLLFGPLKSNLAGKKMATDANIKQTVASWLQTLDTSCFCGEIQALVPQYGT